MMSYMQRNNAYLARQEINEIKEDIRNLDSRRLELFGNKVYSQGDEDGIIDVIFRRLKISKGTFVEIGVENGLECNTLLLLHKGWKGWWFEGNIQHFDFIANKFQSALETEQLTANIVRMTRENINQIFDQSGIKYLDFLSIDIDGMDIYLLEELEIRPKVICIEYNAKWPPTMKRQPVYDPDYVWSGSDYMGSSLLSITETANKKGYDLVGTNITGANAFYVRKDLINKFFPEPNVRSLYNPPRYWLIFDHFQHIGHPADFGEYVK